MRGNAREVLATAVVIESNQLAQRALAALLARWNIEVVGASLDLGRAPALVEAHDCDLLLVGIDEDTPPALIYRYLRRVHKLSPSTATIVLIAGRETSMLDAALASGAYAAIDRSAEADVVAEAIEKALAGRPASAADGDCGAQPRLTRRELEILRLVAEGRSNREVAKLLWVTDQTVKFHLANTYRKLGVRNRFDASLWAVSNGIVRQPVLRKEELVGSAAAAAT
jgi:two-component system, NarL family, response regulator